MDTEGSGASRAGGDGLHNEDVFVVEDGLGLYVVCDGVSGRPAGEVAARVAAAALEEFVAREEERLGYRLRSDDASHAVVEGGLRHALAAVLAEAERDPERSGMSTTVTLLLAHGDRGVIGHAGDSRVYLIRRGRVHQLTVDHELTEALANGGEPAVELDVFAVALRPDDTFVLCSDGAEAVVREPAVVRAAADLSPVLLASRIVSAAHRRDPATDATAVVVRVRPDGAAGWLELSSAPRPVAFGHTIAHAR